MTDSLTLRTRASTRRVDGDGAASGPRNYDSDCPFAGEEDLIHVLYSVMDNVDGCSISFCILGLYTLWVYESKDLSAYWEPCITFCWNERRRFRTRIAGLRGIYVRTARQRLRLLSFFSLFPIIVCTFPLTTNSLCILSYLYYMACTHRDFAIIFSDYCFNRDF